VNSQSQGHYLEVRIDSAIDNSPFKENYRYWYGSSPSDLTDFRMDTITGRLVSFHFKYFGSDTIVVDYYFLDNYLTKMESHRISGGKYRLINQYYFEKEKLVRRHGKKFRIEKQGYFSKFSPRYINEQLSYIYYQFEYFTIFKKRLTGPAPIILEEQRRKIDKQYQSHDIIRR
jgi:hypothetical protein